MGNFEIIPNKENLKKQAAEISYKYLSVIDKLKTTINSRIENLNFLLLPVCFCICILFLN